MAAILAAAPDVLAANPEASMTEIARHAGVVRATVYMHFPDRQALIDAVTAKAVSDVTAVIERAEPDSGDPVDALARVITAAWKAMDRFHALVGINTRRPYGEMQDQHRLVMDALRPLIERGQATGRFRADVPASWHLAMILALVHGASGEIRRGTVGVDQVQKALLSTVLGAVAAPSTPGQP
jgi:TetR/AcrR family transcriptional repressor of mexCD-oprJ operon